MKTIAEDIIVHSEGICKNFTVKSFDGVERVQNVLENISFDLYKGDSLALIGVNGSGKSTLLKILSNIIKPTSGEILIRGRFTSILDVGNGFHPELSGRENIYLYHSLISPNTKPKEEIIISFSELYEHIDTPVKYYSNGMYLRLAFSIAIHAEADLLLLDEVLAVGDSSFMNKCYNKISERRQEGCSFIIASHNINDILKLCNKGIWINDSTMHYYGSIGEAVSKYIRNMYVGIELKPIFNIRSLKKSKYIDVKSIQAYSGEFDGDAIFSFEDIITIEVNLYSHVANNKILPILEIENESGSIIAILGSIYAELITLDYGEFKFKLSIPKMFLNIGLYKINFRILKKDLADIVYYKSALIFRIVQNDSVLNKLQQSNPFHIVNGETSWKITEC
jgi:ABC-type polysaccharide/polyol phosphate transport system ATPase subunit